MNIRNRVKSLRIVPANELRPNPKNWRTHPKAQADALRGVLAEVGMADACLARELPDGSLMLIDGHLRAETLGDGDVPVDAQVRLVGPSSVAPLTTKAWHDVSFHGRAFFVPATIVSMGVSGRRSKESESAPS